MALAQRMEGLKEWGKSAEIYQEIIEKFSDRVVPRISTTRARSISTPAS